ncbi:MAG TPA: tetraacyldisaccharide 4'-kinase [Burkholderiaceae bacterium]|nr:tetraacyldisaccharide 4'-kinase [Burkholderiaceae bacterium]
MATAASPHWSQRLQRAWLARGALACALLPLAALFAAVTALRRALYRVGFLKTRHLPVPVIVVGNLIVGGAGKTPTVLAVIELLKRRGYTPGIVSRGHGGRHAGVLEVTDDTLASASGDEPRLLRRRSGVPVAVGRDRVAAAMQLLLGHPQIDVLVSDDGLQHLALGRDVQVIVFDERGVGNGWLLPAGPLREPRASAAPTRSLVVYNAAAPSVAWPGHLARRSIGGLVSLGDWWQGRAAHADALDALRARPVLAAAGVARPGRFFAMLEQLGLRIDPLPLPDHHDYATLPWPPGTADVIVTEKDAIKLHAERIGATRVWVAPLDFALDERFDTALLALLPPPGARHGNTPAEPARLPDLQGPA